MNTDKALKRFLAVFWLVIFAAFVFLPSDRPGPAGGSNEPAIPEMHACGPVNRALQTNAVCFHKTFFASDMPSDSMHHYPDSGCVIPDGGTFYYVDVPPVRTDPFAQGGAQAPF